MGQDTRDYIPTRQSLLQRLKDWEDQASWKDFFDTYWKLIYGVARRSGLSDAEAQDVVQETVIAVAKKMPEFNYDPAVGSFKGWLMKLTQWRITDQFRKKQYEKKGKRMPREQALSTGLLETHPDPAGFNLEAAWEEEWEKHVMDTALRTVRENVNATQYQLFHLHVVKNQPAQKVAKRLGAKLAQVYFAKYKISALLQKEVKRLEKKMI